MVFDLMALYKSVYINIRNPDLFPNKHRANIPSSAAAAAAAAAGVEASDRRVPQLIRW